MKNAREAAIKILENAKKALKEKVESLEKAEGNNKKVERIPKNHPVQPLKSGDSAKDKATCGHCGLSWDDGVSTSMTPTPSGRCPFEHYHIHHEMEKAEGKNTAQLNEFKGIPQPPTPKAPEKAIAPTPKIPQPKMPSLGKAARPLSSFMQKKMQKAELNKAKIFDIKTGKMTHDLGQPEKTTPPKGNLKLVGAPQESKKPAKKVAKK